MSLPKEFIADIEAIFKRMLPDFLKEDEVQAIALQVFNKFKDPKTYASVMHSHVLSEITDVGSLTKGLSKDGHIHAISDISGLENRIQQAVASVKIPTDFAPFDHSHTVDDLSGQIPISKIAGGDKLLLAANTAEQMKNHTHPELLNAIKAVADSVAALPDPVTFDATPIHASLSSIQAQVSELRKPIQPVVEVQIQPVQAAKVICQAAYLIVSSDPGETLVEDATGKKGTVKVTARGDKYLVRGEVLEARQPLTFTFHSPPILCSIGNSTASLTS